LVLLRALPYRPASYGREQVEPERDRAPCYLDADRESNVRSYERHGYAVQRQEVLLVLDTRIWFRRRPGEGNRE